MTPCLLSRLCLSTRHNWLRPAGISAHCPQFLDQHGTKILTLFFMFRWQWCSCCPWVDGSAAVIHTDWGISLWGFIQSILIHFGLMPPIFPDLFQVLFLFATNETYRHPLLYVRHISFHEYFKTLWKGIGRYILQMCIHSTPSGACSGGGSLLSSGWGRGSLLRSGQGTVITRKESMNITINKNAPCIH